MIQRGLLITGPASGAGKTTVTLGLLRALRNRNLAVRAAKSGPDYIDPAFHAAACGTASVNLDGWAMNAATLQRRAAAQGGACLIVEGAMGVLDAAANGRGSVADLADVLGLPVVLVLDVAKQGQSAVLPAAGLRALRPDLPIAGVILNRVGSARHQVLAGQALRNAGFHVFGAIPRNATLTLPERHLGLVQAAETAGLEEFLQNAAGIISDHVDLDAVVAAARPVITPTRPPTKSAPLGQRIAVASDTAFAFAYPHLLSDWQAAGAQIMPFSPLLDQSPDASADAVFLPGGYPELQAAALSAADHFRTGMRAAADRGTQIYGECGGYMVLGDALIDAGGLARPMLGLLPLVTSFENRRMTLGYRKLTPVGAKAGSAVMAAHEFHYATIISEGAAPRLYHATDAMDATLPDMGLRIGSVSGSFAHVIGPMP